jgi:hypothetical protein
VLFMTETGWVGVAASRRHPWQARR